MGFSGDFDAKTLQRLWDSEATARNTHSSIYPDSELQGVVIANCAQLIVTIGYYFYNSVLTSMLSAAEYSSYGVDRKPLRVTWPVKGSQQRSTYWLSIPYHYGIPIILVFMIIHWFVSQGWYFVLLIPYDSNDKLLYQSTNSLVGFAPLPIIFAAAIGLAMGILLVGLAFRRFKSAIPLAGSCSAAISAACHPPEDVCTDTAALGDLIWGETGSTPDWDIDRIEGSNDQKGHCSFTPLDAQQPSLERSYA